MPAADDRADNPLRRLRMFLTVSEAAAEIGVHPDVARAWLEHRGLLRLVAGQEIVVPDELLADVRGTGQRERHDSAGKQRRSAPINSWRSVAAVLGLSEDTVWRRRKERHDVTPCHFADEDAAHEWWRALNAPPARRQAKPRKSKPVHDFDTALDVDALVRELTGKGPAKRGRKSVTRVDQSDE